VKRANANLATAELPPLPDSLTLQSMRRTFASVLHAPGEPPPVVMGDMGHASSALALRVYARAMRRGEDEHAQLRALIEGVQLTFAGIRRENALFQPPEGHPA
jgi:integrase